MSEPPRRTELPTCQASRQLVRAIRGDVSQVALSRRLGYRSNAVAGWEGGHRSPTLAETLRMAEVRHLDVHGAFERFHERTAEAFDPESPHLWLQAVRGGASNRDVSERGGFSEHQIGRWMRGDSQPRLPDFLALLEVMTGRCTDWVAELVPIERVPCLAPVHQARARVRRLVFEEPWTAGVLTLLGSLRPVGDPVAPIAACLGIEPETVARILQALVEAGVVRLEDGQARVVAPLTVDTKPTEHQIQALRRHWSAVADERLAAPHPADRFHYNVFNVSRADLDHIHELQAAMYRALRATVAASPQAEVTVLYTAHLAVLSEPTDTP